MDGINPDKCREVGVISNELREVIYMLTEENIRDIARTLNKASYEGEASLTPDQITERIGIKNLSVYLGDMKKVGLIEYEDDKIRIVQRYEDLVDDMACFSHFLDRFLY